MKAGILKTTLVAALSAHMVACGDSSTSRKSEAPSSQADTKPTPELTGEPGTAEEMATATYRLKTATQNFVLKKLGHLVWTRFTCKTELVVGHETEPAVMNLTFYPAFKIDLVQNKKTQSLVSADQLCGTPTLTTTTGSLAKNENQYELNYGLTPQGRPILTMKWDATRMSPGEFLCKTAQNKIAKAIVKDCELKTVDQLTE